MMHWMVLLGPFLARLRDVARCATVAQAKGFGPGRMALEKVSSAR